MGEHVNTCLLHSLIFHDLVLLLVTGACLEIITDRSQEGAQFVKGFGGIGGE